jgi:hypothetical protein
MVIVSKGDSGISARALCIMSMFASLPACKASLCVLDVLRAVAGHSQAP